MKIKSVAVFIIALILILCSLPIGVFATTETVYYVSVSGDDGNSGLSPNEPLKTISAVNRLSLKTGTKVLFKRGDIWRGETLYCNSGVYYGAYGEGVNPAFYGSNENYARADYWTLTDTPNVYVSTFTLNSDIGSIVFDNDSWVGNRYMYTTNPTDLWQNGMFFIYDDNTDDGKDIYRIYIFNSTGNPGVVYNEMEFIHASALIKGNYTNGDVANNITVEDITLKYGNFGYSVHGNQKNVTLKGLDISYIGGRWLNEDKIRGGNAIEFYGSSENILVENCAIKHVYDTGFTCQQWGGKNHYYKDITLRNCDISYCHMGVELWFNPYNSWLDFCTIDNVNITGNKFSYSGYGFGSFDRYISNEAAYSVFITSLTYKNYNSLDINISNNVFYAPKDNIFYLEYNGYTPEFSNNTYVLTESSTIGYVGKTLDKTSASELNQMFFEPDATIGQCYTYTNSFDRNIYNTLNNSDFEEAFAEDNWYGDSEISFSEDRIYGERSLSLSGNSVVSCVDAYSDAPYSLGFWYKGNAEVSVSNGVGNELISVRLSGSDWKYYGLFFNTPRNCEKLYITLSGSSLFDRMMLTPYSGYEKISFENGKILITEKKYQAGEKTEFIVLPQKGYELDGAPVLACSDGSLISSEYDENTRLCSFNAPDGNIMLTCYFKRDNYIRGENLISDGGFDKQMGETPWNVLDYWKSNLDVAPANYASNLNKTGDSCVTIQSYGGGAIQSFAVEEGCTYEICFLWAPCSDNGSTTQMKVTIGDFYEKVVSSSYKQYQRFTDTFTATITGNVNLRFNREWYAPNNVYIDDVAVCRITDKNPPKKYSISISEDVLNGKLTLGTNEALAGEKIIIKPVPNKNYSLVDGSIKVYTENGQIEVNKSEDGTYYFIMPETDVTISAEFEFQNASASGTVNILKDSECEAGFGQGWINSWDSHFVTVANQNCIKIAPWAGGIYQKIDVVEGATYELSFSWASDLSNGNETKMHVSVGDYYSTDTTGFDFMYFETVSTKSTAFTTFTTSFTADKTGNVTLKFGRHDCDYIVYIDNITLTTSYSLNLNDSKFFTDDDYIFGITEGTTAEEVINSFTYNNCEFRLNGGDTVKTDSIFTLYVSNVPVLTRSASVVGDCNSDGSVNVKDLVALKKYCADLESMSNAQLLATAINGCEKGGAQSLTELRKLLIEN